jgi:hypothetical protein
MPADAEPLLFAGLRDQVKVHVKDGLMRECAVVLEHVVRSDARYLLQRACEARQDAAHRGGRFVG